MGKSNSTLCPSSDLAFFSGNPIIFDLGAVEPTTLSRIRFFMMASFLSIWILGPLLGVMIFLFIFRIVLTWYPQVDLNSFPFNVVAWPTEPFLRPSRKLIPPLGGVDITPIIWVGIFSLLREILVGQQGLLHMIASAQ